MRQRRFVRLLVVAALTAVALPAWRAAAEGVTKTFFLHSATPGPNVETALNFGGQPNQPTMDEVEPALGPPKSAATGPGNTAFRKNPFLAWWAGAVHGVVSNVTVNIFVGVQNAKVGVTLFGDGGVGFGGPVGHAAVVASRVPGMLSIPIPNVNAPVDKEMVVSIDIGSAGSVMFDSPLAESSVVFTLSPYVPPPPDVFSAAAPGWSSISPVDTVKAQRETSLALSPTDPNLMMGCSPSGVPATGEGHSYFYRSTNNGASWSSMDVENDPSDPRRLAFEGGDCDVAFDAGGNAYSADTWAADLSVGVSRDGGTSWEGTPLAVTSPVVDRPWLVGGPPGTIHITYQDLQFALPTAIWYVRSTDYGKTFTPAVPVAIAGPDGAFSWEGNFVVSPDGQNLWLVYTRRRGPVVTGGVDDSGPETVWIASSQDGGTTWSSKQIASSPNPASYLYPSIGIDASGMLHVVYVSKTDTDRPVWYLNSRDDGATWSAPLKLTNGISAFSPWVAGGRAGEAAIQWYGSPNPAATLDKDNDWYVYAARITGAETASPVIAGGTTTTEPIFHGKQGSVGTPEFNEVRLDANGKMRIGASVMHTSRFGTGWAVLYQAEA